MTDMRVKLILDMLDRISAPARQAAQRFSASMNQMGESARSTGRSMDALGKKATLGLTAPLALLTKQSISVQKEFEGVRAKMIGVFRDAGKADEQMKRLRMESDRMGTVFLKTADGYSGFSASALGAGFTVEKVNEMFREFTETSVALKATPEKMGFIFKALEQMAGKPSIQLEELKTQLSDHIPNSIGIAAKAMNMSVPQFLSKLEKGLIKTSVFLPLFAKQMREELGAGFDEASQGLQAFENRQTNSLRDAELQANKSGLQDFYKRLREIIGDLSRAFLNLSPAMQKFTVYAGIGAMVFGPLLIGIGQMAIGIGYLLPALGALAPMFVSAATSIAGFGAALFATPIGWFALAVGAVAVGAILLIKNWEKVSTFFSSMWEGIKSTFMTGVSWVMNLIQPLLDAVDRISNSSVGRRLGFGGSTLQAGSSVARASGAAVSSGVGANASGLDAGGTIKIQIDSNGQPKVKEMKTNDKRVNYSTDTGLLMGTP